MQIQAVQIQAKSSLPYKKFMGFYRERTKCKYLHGTYVAHAHIVYTYAAQGMYVACPPEWLGFWLNLIGLLTSTPTVPTTPAWLVDADGTDDAGLAGCRRRYRCCRPGWLTPAWLVAISLDA